MRRILPLLLVLGCSRGSSQDPATTPAGSARPVRVEVGIASLVPAAATAVTRTTIELFPLARLFGDELHARDAACWTTLEQHVTAAYQLELKARHTSVFVVEGDLPRVEVEACARQAFVTLPEPLQVKTEGELTAFRSASLGTVYAAWRGRFVVAGDQQSVRDALAGPGPGSAWPARIAALPPAKMAIAGTDHLFGSLIGVDSTGWDAVIDTMSAYPETPIRLAGRVIVHATTPAQAALGAQHVAAGELQFVVPLPPSLTTALRRLKVTVSGSDVALGFDAATFDGVDWGAMAALAGSLKASMPAPP